jgi:hypothetical protein
VEEDIMQAVEARTWRWGAVVAVVLALVFLWAAPPAQATPANTMNLIELQQLLGQNGGRVSGYLKTVLKGDAIEEIPVTFTSIVPHMTQDGALIMFEVNDSRITALGGIIAGMSGSPMYVPVSGKPDQLVGALSYGDAFTLGNLGLATPIEYMVAIQEQYFPTAGAASANRVHVAQLADPVTVGGQTIRSVVVAPSAAAARQVGAGSDAAVFAPLTVVQIGGPDPHTQAYKKLAEQFKARGLDVMAGGGGSDGGTIPPTLTGGAAFAVLYTLGDVWIGSAGTATYVDGTTFLGFGHPLEAVGATEAYLTAGRVDGIWGSALMPYKFITPTAPAGTITQDRNSGVAGTLGILPAPATVNSQATFNGVTRHSSSTLSQWMASNWYFTGIVPYVASAPIYTAIDAWLLPGSATTTSSIVVSDGSRDYTVRHSNMWDNAFDVTFSSTNDLYLQTSALTANPDGIAAATIKSVSFEATLTAERHSARVVGVRVPGGLKAGANDVQVRLAAWGVAPLQTAHVRLEIPKGTPLRGVLEVYGVGGSQGSASVATAGAARRAGRSAAADDRLTLPELVELLNEWPQNNDLIVTYRPESESGEAVAIQVIGETDWVVSGSWQVPVSSMQLAAEPRVIRSGARSTLFGVVELPGGRPAAAGDEDLAVAIWAAPKGSTPATLVATVPATVVDGSLVFSYRTARLTQTMRYTAVWGGDDYNIGSRRSVVVTVRKAAAAR